MSCYRETFDQNWTSLPVLEDTYLAGFIMRTLANFRNLFCAFQADLGEFYLEDSSAKKLSASFCFLIDY